MGDGAVGSIRCRMPALLRGALVCAAALRGHDALAQWPRRTALASSTTVTQISEQFDAPVSDPAAPSPPTFAFPQLAPFRDDNSGRGESSDAFVVAPLSDQRRPTRSAGAGNEASTARPTEPTSETGRRGARSGEAASGNPVSDAGGRPAANQAARDEPYRPDMKAKRRKIDATFRNGLTWRSDDDYFALTFHNLSQFDLRVFHPTGDPLVDNFVIPRQRWYFEGHVSEYVSYYTVINRGYGPLDFLDSFVDFNFEGRPIQGERLEKAKLEVRVGRMKTPYTYEYIKMSENNLITAERSVFVGNFAGNRQLGVMAHGEVLEERLEYAVGVFNGQRRSFQDFNNGKDLFTFLNTKPFLTTNVEALRQLNLGGSFNFGREHNPLQPAVLRTANDQSRSDAAATVSPAFLTFNPGDIENGVRMQWSGDVAYYYRSLGIMSGYQGGFQNYSTSATTPLQTRVPFSGYEVSLFYLVTGEEITIRRDLLEPRNPLGRIGSLRGGEPRRGIGAIELFGRFANMHLGGDVLTSGLATAASANNANVTDLGFNWYLNHYVKLTFDYQYAAYNRAVALTPSSTTRFNNLFWFRSQIYF